MKSSNLLIIAVILAASSALGGCALFLEGAAIGEAGLGIAEAGAAEGAGAVASAAEIGISADLAEEAVMRVGSGTRAGALSNSFAKITEDGQVTGRLTLAQDGTLRASNQIMARIDSTGDILALQRKIGFIEARDGLVYDLMQDGSHSPIGQLEGFVRENGVQVTSQFNNTLIRILRQDVAIDVIGVRPGFYLLRLPSGEVGLVPSAAVGLLSLLGLKQVLASCPDGDREGALVRQSGEVVRFSSCREADGAFVLNGASGDAIIDANDVKAFLVGDGVPGVKGDEANARIQSYANAAAAAVGAAPGDQAMTVLATSAPVPQLENALYAAPFESGVRYRHAIMLQRIPYSRGEFAQGLSEGGQMRAGGFGGAGMPGAGPGFARLGPYRQDYRPQSGQTPQSEARYRGQPGGFGQAQFPVGAPGFAPARASGPFFRPQPGQMLQPPANYRGSPLPMEGRQQRGPEEWGRDGRGERGDRPHP